MNKEQKERFIKGEYDGKTSKETAEIVMEDVEEEEDRIGKDATDWSYDETLVFFKSLGTSSIHRLNNYSLITRKYAEWILKKEKEEFKVIDGDVLLTCLNVRDLENKIVSRKDIEWACSIFPNPANSFLLLAIFEGILGKKMEDLIYIKLSDIDMDKEIAKLHSGRIVNVSKKLIKYAVESEAEYKFWTISGDERIMNYKEISDIILKPKKNSSNDIIGMPNNILYQMINYCGLPSNLTPNSILESGILDLIKTRSQQLNISHTEYIRKYEDEIFEKYGKKKQSVSNIYRKNKGYI